MAQLGVSQHSSHDPNVTRVYAAIQEHVRFSERGAILGATNLDIESEWHAASSRNVCLSACPDPASSSSGGPQQPRCCPRMRRQPCLPCHGTGPPHRTICTVRVQSFYGKILATCPRQPANPRGRRSAEVAQLRAHENAAAIRATPAGPGHCGARAVAGGGGLAPAGHHNVACSLISRLVDHLALQRLPVGHAQSESVGSVGDSVGVD